MKDPISIIVPVYNAERTISRCIDSIIAQTYKDIEIILVNDGSNDNSKAICETYLQKDNRIKLINKNNGGVSTARNSGLMNANGKYVQFVDSDDTIMPNMSETLLENMHKTAADLVICGLNIYKNNILLRTPHLENKIVMIKNDIQDFKFIHKVFASPCNKLYCKKYIVKNFETEFSSGEDIIFNLNYLKNINTICTIDACLYNVFLDNELSLNRKFKENRLDITLNLIDLEMKFCNETYGTNSDNIFIYNSYILAVHAFFRDLCSYYTRIEYKSIAKKYLEDSRINSAVKKCIMDRNDYKIFKFLLQRKMLSLLYYFLKLKKLIRGE